MLPHLRTRVPGPRSRARARQLRRVESRNVTHISAHGPIFWERARGANVWDADGNRYLDLTAGFGVASLGHGHPRVVAAIQRQAGRLLHAMGDVHPNALKVELANELVKLTFRRWGAGAARVLFTNSGAEAVEAALKTAVLQRGRPGIIAFQGGYHGLTYGALAATARPDFRQPFRNQLGRFVTHVPYGTVPPARLARNAGAVLVEPIQGRGGIVVPPDDFLPGLRRYCDRHGLLLILDEVYTGFGRTGRWFACEHPDVVPDVICVGKALGGGFPISACVGRAAVMDRWPVSTGEALHTSTFLGNPVGCAAALAAVTEMKRLRLPQRAQQTSDWLVPQLTRLGKVRGRGLMLGLEVANAVPLMDRLLKRGVIAIPEGEHAEILGITPPLTISRTELAFCLKMLREIVAA